jgi:TnpA family transposase
MRIGKIQVDGSGAEAVGKDRTMRLRILSDDEIHALYERPRFTQEEREEYFVLSAEENAALAQLHSLKSRMFFILHLGYFKARRMFFTFSLRDVEEDAAHIRRKYFLFYDDADPAIAEGTRLKHQRLILNLCKYRNIDAVIRRTLEARARQTAAVCGKPIYIFRELMDHLAEQRVVAPGYSTMQDIIGGALAHEQRRLAAIVENHVDPTAKEALDRLLENPNGLHEITLLKRDPRDFSNREIRREAERREEMRTLYDLSQRLLPRLNISKENIRYYASLVDYYTVHRLRQLNEPMIHVYLLCFIQHRYQRLHDNLIQSLLHHVRRYDDDAREAAREMACDFRLETNADMTKGGQVLRLFTDDSIAGDIPFKDVRRKAFVLLPAARIDAVADCLATSAGFDEKAFEWQHLDKAAQRFKINLRPILHGVQFEATAANAPLIEGVRFLTEASRSGKPLTAYKEQDIPLRWVPEKTKRYLYENDGRRTLLPDRYEFLLYRQLRNGVDAGDIFCRDSVRFRSITDDLVDEALWRERRDGLIAEARLDILHQPIEAHLAELKDQLETRIAEVNRRIAAGENEHFKLKGNGRWTLEYPSDGEAVNHSFFDRLMQTDLNSVLRFADRQCQFMDAFTHCLARFAKQSPDKSILSACIAGWATNTGLARMGQISDIPYHILASTSDNFLRLETLREANDLICNATAALPIFRHYDIGGVIHSSSDGQKFETAVRTFNARHSPKYFGLKKGIVRTTMVANHVPVNARNISADDHESHFVFDLVYNNTTDIQSDSHSVDGHGINHVNAALLYVFSKQFAPRYRDICDKVRTSLIGFHHPSRYGDVILKPARKVKANDIIQEWDECRRIFVSLARKDTTQSTLVRKLSSHARNSRVKHALWEYDGIHSSLHLLNYIDSPSLRQNIQKALNRGENYHQLCRAISYAGFGKLRFKQECEQELWAECSRLIANCIIFYNASILSRLLEHQESIGDTQGAEATKKVCPVAWQHINLQGRFEFLKSPDSLNVDAIIRELTTPQADRVVNLFP